jgi:outer membrane protein OmpA-like peptidoglycan-associated protein
MRHNFRRQREQDEEESVFVSMTDMTVSFLFIVILLLAYFASHFSTEAQPVPVSPPLDDYDVRVRLDQAECEIDSLQSNSDQLNQRVKFLEQMLIKFKDIDPLEKYLNNAAITRTKILIALRDGLKKDFPSLMIDISAESDALRFQDEGLFGKGESQLSPEKKKVVAAIASRLDELLPSYTFGEHLLWNEKINPNAAIIEAILIEGHTDADGDDVMNLHLSTARANATFIAMLQAAPKLTSYLNNHSPKKQPVLSVAGYGKMRPVASNETPQGKATNRRIDLRIIMHTPQNLEEVERIKMQLKGVAEQEK